MGSCLLWEVNHLLSFLSHSMGTISHLTAKEVRVQCAVLLEEKTKIEEKLVTPQGTLVFLSEEEILVNALMFSSRWGFPWAPDDPIWRSLRAKGNRSGDHSRLRKELYKEEEGVSNSRHSEPEASVQLECQVMWRSGTKTIDICWCWLVVALNTRLRSFANILG